MHYISKQLFTLLLGSTLTLGLTQCGKKGCTDPDANNYNQEASKDDDSCTYPTIQSNAGGDDGDVTGSGGSATSTHTWTNGESRAELNMDITSTNGGSFQVVVHDADGKEVLNETLVAGQGDDSKSKCSASGSPGTWEVTITLTDFDGDGSFTLSQGC